jgi:N-acetylglutamate synthase
MRILIVGATGVLGRATLPHLRGHDVVGTTRAADKRAIVEALGARAEVCDVYEPGAMERVARACAPEIVVNFLTDLSGGRGPGNRRIRAEGGPVVTAAARACGARRLVLESIAFAEGPEAVALIDAFEGDALGSGLDAVVLRFGRFWGPGTWDAQPSPAPAIHVDEAGRRAAALIVDGARGVHVVAHALDDGLTLRALSPTDHAAVTALWRVSEGVRISPGDAEDELAAFLRRNPGLSLVAFANDGVGDRIVGTVLCGHDGRRGYIYHLAVAASHQRRGLGRALAAASLAGLAREGIRRAQVSVFVTNEVAKTFWARLGGQRRDELNVFSIPLT